MEPLKYRGGPVLVAGNGHAVDLRLLGFSSAGGKYEGAASLWNGDNVPLRKERFEPLMQEESRWPDAIFVHHGHGKELAAVAPELMCPQPIVGPATRFAMAVARHLMPRDSQ
jgi:hypothetical protein